MTKIEPGIGPARKRLLLVAYYAPERGTGGGLRLLDMYRLLSERIPELSLTLLTCDHGEMPEPELAAIFDRDIRLPLDAFNEAGIRGSGVLDDRFDAVDLQFLQAGDLAGFFRRSGVPRVVVSPMESHVRAAMLAIGGLSTQLSSWKRWLLWDLRFAWRELRAVWRADRAMCVSNSDARVLAKFRFWGGVRAVETGISPKEFPKGLRALPNRTLQGTPTVVFLAYFGSQTNQDALDWYLHQVHPFIKAAVPAYRFRVVGRGLATLPCALDENVDIVGEVDSLEAELSQAWVGIAPALGGAGLRGKINQYAIEGVPCVASALAGKGFAYEPGFSICLAGCASEFAGACIDLLTNPERNREMGRLARDICLREYTWDSRLPVLREIFSI
ncbi:glycosyltransferase family 4 protein [Dyella sp. 20L07]|uniref:glycosyltransferase family 4 protein n=1 Tax=Dyella sp. 20L07 TaxID=3384240 RepID=UPI003D2C2C19